MYSQILQDITTPKSQQLDTSGQTARISQEIPKVSVITHPQ